VAGIHAVVLLPLLSPALGVSGHGRRGFGYQVRARPRLSQRRGPGKNLHGL